MRCEIPLHGINFRHGIGDRCPRGKDQTLVPRDLIDVLCLHVEIPCLLHMIGRPDTCNAGMPCHDLKILELMRLIDDELVNAQLLERNHIVHALAVRLLEFPEPCRLIVDELRDVADGEVIRRYTARTQGKKPVLEFVDVTLPHRCLTSGRQLDLFKRGCTDDDGVPILRRDARDKLLPVLLLKVLLLRDEDLRTRIEPLELLAGLRREMVRNDHERLV